MRFFLIVFIASAFASCQNHQRVNSQNSHSFDEDEFFLISSLTETESQNIKDEIEFKTNVDDLTYGYRNNVLGCEEVKNPRICSFCMGKNEPSEIVRRLMSEGLEFGDFEDPEGGHCYGISACFVKFLNQNPEFAKWDVKKILNKFYNQKDLAQTIHDVSIAQPSKMFPLYVFTGNSFHKEISPEKYNHCLTFYFETIFGKNTWFDYAVPKEGRDPKLFNEAFIFSN